MILRIIGRMVAGCNVGVNAGFGTKEYKIFYENLIYPGEINL